VIVPHVLSNNSLFSYSAPGSAGLLEDEWLIHAIATGIM